ncbi:MAG: PHB depolymerase family esterase [Gemmatimonadota bacterium]
MNTKTARHVRFLYAGLFSALAAADLGAQALTNITSLYVSYATRKNTVKPEGELKARLDTLEREFRAANSAGRTGEVRRLLAKGNALLANRPWTDVADYGSSLVLRSDRVVVESQKPYAVRLEQLYAPAIDLTPALSAHATLVRRASAGAMPEVVKDFGTFQGVSRDLKESPFGMELDARDVSDGRYIVTVEVKDSSRTLGTVALPIVLRKGIDDVVARFEREAATVPAALRAEILYPVDRMRNVNRGRLELRTLDVDADFAAADAVLAAVKSGKDPMMGRTGDLERHYTLEAASEVMPYHLYVPKGYSSQKRYPLIIALHGLGGTEDAFFDGYGKKLPELAETNGYIVAAPLGYRVDGFYGWGLGNPPADYSDRRTQELSEKDVMQVLAEVKKLYSVDDNRTYLMGHSMGAIGTWRLAAKYPDIWAALGVFSGQGTPATLEKFRSIPEFVVHGDADPTVNVAGSRNMVAAMKPLGVDVTYIEVPGGNHSNVVEPNLAGMIKFFDAHSRSKKP